METTETTETTTSGSSRMARITELEAAVGPNMPTWGWKAGNRWDSTDCATFELACLLEAIEMPEKGLGDDITLGATLVRDWDDICDQALADEQDAKNFYRVLEVAHAVAVRLGWMSDHFPPEAMEYIRRVVGLKLVERFVALARNV